MSEEKTTALLLNEKLKAALDMIAESGDAKFINRILTIVMCSDHYKNAIH